MSPRVRLLVLALLSTTGLLITVAMTPAGAVTQPGHRALAAPALSGRRGTGFGNRIAPKPSSPARAPRLGGLHTASGFGSALVGSAPVGNGPAFLAVNRATHTIYVANGYNDNGPNAGGDTVSVIDARHCNAQDVSRCKGPWPTITVGNGTLNDLPGGIAIDMKTDTVYVANVGADTVSVFNGATCNATVTSGCGQTPAEIPVGLQPLTLVTDPASHTVYVADYGAPALGGPPGNSTTVSMINSATCNATNLATCPAKPPPTVNVGAAPDDVTVNQATHTVYVTTIGAHRAQNGWAVFDANTCNATTQAGCGALGRLPGDPIGPNAAAVDPANDTLYTANYDNTISAFDLAHCWAGDLAGCATDKPGTVTPFPQPGFEHDLYVAVDARLHSVYVTYQFDAALVVVNSSVCNARHLSACAALHPPTIHTGAGPEEVVLDGQTLYTANEIDSTVSVINAARCNARTTSGCRHPAPAVAIPGPGALAADPAAHTTYVTSGTQSVSMINTQACNTHHLAGCAQTPAQATVGTYPDGVAADPGTHTIYIANYGSGTAGTVSVLNAATCNASSQAGCTHLPALQVPGGHPDGIVADPATGTLYVTTITAHGPNLISVFNAATCNATDTAGCGQKPVLLRAGHSAKGDSDLSAAVNDRTDTLYVTNVQYATQDAHTVYVFNAATCDATVHTGCGQAPATITVGDDPRGMTVDPATDTIYVANHAAGDYPATVSVINGATCNGTDHTGCGQTPPTTAAGFGAIFTALDPSTHQVYVTNLHDTSVSVINGATCNGTDHTGCGQTPAEDAVGNYPYGIAVDAAVGTAYVSNLDNTVSVIPLNHCPAKANR